MVKIQQLHRAKAVVNIIAINGELFNEKIIISDKHEISVIPEDSPSNPSIKLMAFVIPTIHPTVRIYTKITLEFSILSINSILVLFILTPNAVITMAAII